MSIYAFAARYLFNAERFKSNLNNKKLISQASLASMTLPQGQQGSQNMKGFKVACVLEQV